MTMANENSIEGKTMGKQGMAQTKAEAPFKNIAIIGLGLIGASFAASIKKAYPDTFILGIDSDSRTNVVAQERHWVNEAVKPDSEVFDIFIKDRADLVVLATPVKAVDDYLARIDSLGFSGTITDTISTKSHIIETSDQVLTYPQNYIPGHPMSGSEQNGIDGARGDLFEGSNWVLCPDESTDPDKFKNLHELICGISARVISLPREDHDRAVAIVSHVPHIIASSLVQLAQRHSDDSRALMRLAAGGFKDTTRIAAGSPDLWTGIAFDNIDALEDGLDEMRDIIESFKTALAEDNRDAFKELLASSAAARRSLPSAWVPGSDKLLEVKIPMVNRTGVVAEVTTIASSVGCNIQSIEIDHLSEGNAVLSLILTDEGDIGQLSFQLINSGYSVSFSPIEP